MHGPGRRAALDLERAVAASQRASKPLQRSKALERSSDTGMNACETRTITGAVSVKVSSPAEAFFESTTNWSVRPRTDNCTRPETGYQYTWPP